MLRERSSIYSRETEKQRDRRKEREERKSEKRERKRERNRNGTEKDRKRDTHPPPVLTRRFLLGGLRPHYITMRKNRRGAARQERSREKREDERERDERERQRYTVERKEGTRPPLSFVRRPGWAAQSHIF